MIALRWYAAVAARMLTAIGGPGHDQDDRRRPTPSQPPEHTAHVGTVAPFADAAAALAWGDRELENIVTLVERHTEPSGPPDQFGPPRLPDQFGPPDQFSPPRLPDQFGPPGPPDQFGPPRLPDQSGPSRTSDHRAVHVSVLCCLLHPYLLRRGRVAETEVLGRAALRAARRLGDEVAEAYALGDLAGRRFLTGRRGDALDLTDRDRPAG
ncbi:hypothetical protein GCM10010451_64430 [Streptomyces virens]|uniref:Uncharacterized protein n=1 Tax=Streptomyces virens TaxID=285572 RepID=A0ABP6QAR4_9ACTN|nr:hypothetical protein [Streptomyces calvus]MBA8976972.1 hypothetical protein [Streptomyces calvus]